MEREKGLQRGLTTRQLAMIAIGGAIGTGLFLGSGMAIGFAGPSVIVSYLIGAVIALLLMGCLAEMTVAHPTTGSFGAHAERYVNPWAGFSVRYAYWFSLVCAVGTEVSAMSVYMKYWFPDVPGIVWIVIFSAVLLYVNATSVNLFGTVEDEKTGRGEYSLKKKQTKRVVSAWLATALAAGALFPLTAVDAAGATQTNSFVALRTGLNVNAPDAPPPYPKGEHKLLPGEPAEPAAGTWGYDGKTGTFKHPTATPDNEGPQPFEGSLPYLDQNQYLKNMKIEGFYPYVAGWGHSWQATFDLNGRRYLYDYETTMYNVYDITDPRKKAASTGMRPWAATASGWLTSATRTT